MDAKPKLYIAYGSNMNIEQMSHRCPTAKVVESMYLEGYRLRFRGGAFNAVATVESSPNDRVPITVWEIYPRDEESLDLYEGYPHLYRKEILNLKLHGTSAPAMIYIMNPEQHPYGCPSKFYFDIIRDGYVSAGFDPGLLQKAVAENIIGERIQ